MPKSKRATLNTLRRSFALPTRVVDQAIGVAPEELRHNLNRLVTVALQEFVARRQTQAFEEEMAAMAADPGLRAASDAISGDFAGALSDGLPG